MSCARILCILCLLSMALPAHADTIPDAVRQKLLLPAGELEMLPVEAVKGEPRDAETAKRSTPKLLSLRAGHVGGQRLLFRVAFDRASFFASTITLFLDLDNNPQTGISGDRGQGADLRVLLTAPNRVSAGFYNAAFSEGNTWSAAVLDDQALWIAVDAPLVIKGDRVVGGALISSLR